MITYLFCIGSSFLVAIFSCMVVQKLSKEDKNKWKKYTLIFVFLLGSLFWGIGPQFYDYANGLTVSFIGVTLGIFFIIAFFSSILGILLQKIMTSIKNN